MSVSSQFPEDVEHSEVLQEQCELDQDARGKLIDEISTDVKDMNARMDVLNDRLRQRETKLEAENQAFLGLREGYQQEDHDTEQEFSEPEQGSATFDQEILLERNDALILENDSLIQENHSLIAERDSLEEILQEYERLRTEDQRAYLMSVELASSNCQAYSQASEEMHTKIMGLYSQVKNLETANATLRSELEDENTHHRIAVRQVTALNEELDSRNRHYDEVFEEKHVLERNYRIALEKLNSIYAKMLNLEKAHTAAKAHVTKTYDMFKRASAERDELREVVVKQLDRSAMQTDAIKGLFKERENLRITLVREIHRSSNLNTRIEKLRGRNRELEEALTKSDTRYDTAMTKLEKALEQKEEALLGQLEALRMVDSLKREQTRSLNKPEKNIDESEQSDEEDVFLDCVEELDLTDPDNEHITEGDDYENPCETTSA